MKHHYSRILTLLFIFISLAGKGQQITVNNSVTIPFTPWQPHQSSGPEVLCAMDTVAYPEFKATAFVLLNVNNSNSAQAMYQYYDCPQEMAIYGAAFFAYAPAQPNPVNVVIKLYLATADSLPMGLPLATDTVSVDSNHGLLTLAEIQKRAFFPNPVTVNQPYIIVMENKHAQSVSIVCSDYTIADGDSEWLSGANFPPNNWVRGYDVNVGGTPFNADVMLLPYAEYDISADFMADSTCLNLTDTVCFTNLSSPVINNRMYNQYAYLNLPSSSWAWDYGDGSGFNYNLGICHAYSGNGPYTVYLYASHYGWYNVCGASANEIVGLPGLPTASFIPTINGLTVDFQNTSSGAANVSWDFGDGNSSTVFNPSHVYSGNGTYFVTLDLSNGCGTGSVMDTVIINCNAPSASFTWNNTNLSVHFTNTSSNGTSYSWDYGDGANSTINSPTHVYTSYGDYLVTLIVMSNCGNDTLTDSIHIQQPVSILHNFGNGEVHIKPNPARETVFVELTNMLSPTQISILDLQGREVTSMMTNGIEREIMVDVTSISQGIYILMVKTDKAAWATRLSIVH